jgi:hypothetical protein
MQPTVADRNFNPGNLKDTKTGKFRQFSSEGEGYSALMNDLQGKVKGTSTTGLNGNSTLHDFANTYAPPSDNNNSAQYTVNLANKMGVRPDTKLSELQNRIPDFAQAVASNEGYTSAKGFKSSQPQDVSQGTQPETPPTDSNAWFPSKPNDTPLEAGLKTVGNIIPSAIEFGKGALHALNPLNTLNTLSQIPEAFSGAVEANKGILPALAQTARALPGEAAKAVIPQGIRQLATGDIEGAQKSFTENPVGTVAPVVLGVRGGAEILDNLSKAKMSDYVKNMTAETAKQPIPKVTNYGGAVDTAMSNIARKVTEPIGKVADAVTGGIGTMVRSMASSLTSLDPQTITQVLSDPKQFSKMAQEETSRGGLAGEVKTGINTRLKDLQEVGTGYDSVRNSNQVIQAPNFMADVLSKNGLKLKNGEIIADTNSVTRNTADINALQKFYNNWGNKTVFTPNEFLNMRGDIAELSKFDKLTGMGKTPASATIGKDIYSKANETMRDTQMPELKALDDTYSPEVKFLKQVKKDYFNPDGTFKDNAVSKIANAGNKGELLKRLESIMPGITKRLQILKAVEDIEASMGVKVGTYTRGVLQGGSIMTGNIPGIIATIITHPTNAVRILRVAGYTGAKVAPILEALKVIGGKVNKPSIKGLLPSLISQQATQ